MQEDKTSKWFASLLRKQQEENPLPYELGAWEAFSKKRATLARKKTAYWISGIAASLALLIVAGGIWLSNESNSEISLPSDQIAMEDRTAISNFEKTEIDKEPITENSGKEEIEKSDLAETETPKKSENQVSGSSKEPTLDFEKKNSVAAEVNTTKPNQDLILQKQQQAEKQTLPNVLEQPKVAENPTNPNLMQSLIATQEKTVEEKDLDKSVLLEEVVIAKELPKDPQLTEAEIEEILETPSFARLALGLSPGYGASQTSAQATSGSSLGLGVMVDMDIVGKLSMGSGLAVNYLNQASESQSYAQVAGFSSPVTEKNEIAQVQVDIPIYFKYPITRNQSISVQAGFSNLVTFNQSAETESSYTRQVAVFDANAVGLSNSFTLKSESASMLSDLNVPQNRFFPLATANLGVNFRLFESKKTSYEVMPFYNYPLQEFSGYGEKLGMFGASFKVNFGTIQR